MKKTMMIVFTLGLLVAMFALVAPAYAAPDTGKGPGNGGTGGGNGNAGTTGPSILSAYMPDAAAEVLGLESANVAASFDTGETFYTIALANGFAQDDLAGLFAEARALATANAAADGLVIQAQTQLNTNLHTNTATQSQLNGGTCDGTGNCAQPNQQSRCRHKVSNKRASRRQTLND